jgi:p-hydroxybenzoate 3-monooxygenase
MRTQVGIVGGGPAGLMLSHLLQVAGIDSVAIETRSRDEIERTHRAGSLECDSVRLLVDSGVSDRVLSDRHERRGIDRRFGGVSHRIDFQGLVGASTWLYPQTDVFIDLANARERDGGDIRYGVTDTAVVDVTSDQPGMLFTDAAGVEHVVRCDVLGGADGSRSMTRSAMANRQEYFRQYPFAWFGILCEAPPSAAELIYTRSDHGFALISQWTAEVQRMYFHARRRNRSTTGPGTGFGPNCRPGWPARTASGSPRARSSARPCCRSACTCASRSGTATCYWPAMLPTQSRRPVRKGLNLALADVRVLAEVLERAVLKHDKSALDAYTPSVAPGLEGAVLLGLDDDTAARGVRRVGLRRTAAARRTVRRRRLPPRPQLPGRGLHRLAQLALRPLVHADQRLLT